MDYHRGLAWTIMDYHGLLHMHPKPLTTFQRYGAGMAHTVASIGFVDYRAHYNGVAWITNDDGLWIIMDYR